MLAILYFRVCIDPALAQGHYGVLFAKALGAEVYVFSHSARKQADALKMGADHFVVSSDKVKLRTRNNHPNININH